MAKKRKEDSTPSADGKVTKLHNVKEQNRIIKAAADRILTLKAEKASIQSLITEERGKVKALGIKMVDFNYALRLYDLEEEDRNESIDSIRVAYQALGIGEQGALFPGDED